MNLALFKENMDVHGYCVFTNTLSDDFIQRLNNDCLKWVDICEQYQIKAGINALGDGTAHHSVGSQDSIDSFIDKHLFHEYLNLYFNNAPYILHACNPVGGLPKKLNYVHNIHRDTRTFIPEYHFRINMLVMLNDFTEENGATQVLVGSHRSSEPPDEEFFNENYVQLLGRAGTVVLFDSYLWHRAGLNVTEKNRVALTLSYGPAFIKPQMDYARLLGETYGHVLSELTRQVLGYNSRVPTSLSEWYQKPEHRLYHSNQG
ncbi:phytanoyl-CoA dioxygenase family protein [Methyloradius palustris]|nr:phytanoyl-CoA dioxygenase family protein [Methyloradius palustris]